MRPLKKMRKSELIVLLENRESAFTEQENVIVRQKETLARLEHENFELVNENESLKRSLESKDARISDLRKEIDYIRNKDEEFWRSNKQLSRELEETKDELNGTRSCNDTLLELVKTLQPKENQKPAKCEKGEWCVACHFNKQYTFFRNGKKERLNICMKNCSCNNFVAKED